MAGGHENDGFGVEWRRLHANQLDLRRAIAAAETPEERAALISELEGTRRAIADFEASAGAETSPPDRSIGDGLLLSTSGQHTASGDQEVDDLFNSLGLDQPAPSGDRPTVVVGPDRRPRAPVWMNMLTGALATALIVALGAIVWLIAFDGTDGTTGDNANVEAGSPALDVDLAHEAEELAQLVDVLGLDGVTTELRGSVIHLSGSVEGHEDFQTLVEATQALGDADVDLSAITVADMSGAGDDGAAVTGGEGSGGDTDTRSATLQGEFDRLLAGTPIVFTTGQRQLTDLQLRILNTAVGLLRAYPDVPVRVVGYTDDFGSEEANLALSLDRAEAVVAYLVDQGVPEGSLIVEGRGELDSSGSTALAGLERRVEFEVVSTAAPTDMQTLRIGIVAPSASNDLAFTQSMVDAANLAAGERSNVEVEVVDNTFVPEDAAAAVTDFAERDFDLVIAHGSQFGDLVTTIAAEFPAVAFAWGTVDQDSGLPNVYTYDVAAEEGGYVLGALAAELSSSAVVGAVGPIEVGDAKQFIDGFTHGAAEASPSATAIVAYTGSFSDAAIASEAARAHVAAGADVLTGTSQMAVGALTVAEEADAAWFGNQANQTVLAPANVVASQVYHWEVVLRPIIAEIDNGTVNGRLLVADLANGGLIIERNPDYALSEAASQRLDQLIADVTSGAIDP